MTIYRAVGGVNRTIKQQFKGVGGVNREIQEQYRGFNGINRKVFNKKILLYNAGDECTDFTGGWDYCWLQLPYTSGFVTKNASNITFGDESTGYGNPFLFTKNKVNLIGFSTLNIQVDVTYSYCRETKGCSFEVDISDTIQTSGGQRKSENMTGIGKNFGSGYTSTDEVMSLDISAYQKPVEVTIGSYSHSYGSDKITIVLKKVWLE